MANPLKILTVLTASQAVKMEQGLDVNNQKITNVANATNSADVVAYGQLTDVSGAIKSYVDAQDSALSGAVKSYVDAQDSALSGALKSYVDAQNTAQDLVATAFSGAIKAYVDAADTADAIAWAAADSALSGALKSYVDAQNTAQDLASTSFSSSIKSYVDAQDTADAIAWAAADSALSGAMKSYVDAQDTALSGAVSSSLAAETGARVAEDLTFLKLDGTRSMTGALNMGGQDITSAKSGSFSGDVTVGGNLQVNGALTYVNSTNLEVTDKTVTIAKGAANATAADEAGIYVDGANTSVYYDYRGGNHYWVLNAAQGIDVDGSGISIRGGEAMSDAVGDKSVLRLGGSFGAVETYKPAVLRNALTLSGSSNFSYITSVTRDGDGLYNVDAAIHALDVAVSGAANQAGNDLATLKSNYDALRQVVTGTLSSGTALLTLSGAQFAAAEIDNLALDVMIDADNTGYTNDLVAIKMYVDGSAVKVQIDAPAAPSAKYRLIVVNEADSKL